MSTLLIDIGNTRIKWRLTGAARQEVLDASSREPGGSLALTQIDQVAGCWNEWVRTPPDAVLVSNVASEDTGAIVERSLRATWPAIRLAFATTSARQGGVINGYAQPEQLGVDRWMAMIGAHALLPDHSLLVCSFGTATTIDLLVKRDAGPADHVAFVGGMILPGLDTMRHALIGATARLADRPGRFVPFATNTDDAITTGIVTAQLGAVERAWRAARGDGDRSLVCVVAGGSAPTLVPLIEALGLPTRVVAELVLDGLAVLARESG